ncbi:MAG TPA: ATP-binding protein [Terriglobales bacterium]|nr:ATP-binding protein [Terriglobales bacterium]
MWPRSTLGRYVLSVVVIGIATWIRWALSPVLGAELPFIILFPAIMLVAWVGGLGPALLGVALGIVSADWFFIPPLFQLGLRSKHDIGTAYLFVFVGVVTGAMSGAYARKARISEEARRRDFEQRAELERIYESVPVGLAFLDRQLRYIRVNNVLAELNHLSAEAHVGRSVAQVLPRNAAILEPMLTQVLATGKAIVNLEIQLASVAHNGELRDARLSFYPVKHGKLEGIHAVVQDVTAEKKTQNDLMHAEAQLRQAVKMEAIGRLAGGIAHDFNNLLMVIGSYTELLLSQLEGQPAYVKKLQAIVAATERAARLTRQLLAFSRKQTLQPQVLEVDRLVKNYEQVLCQVLGNAIHLDLELSSGDARVKVDPAQLEQAILTLAMNARDAMPNGGRVVIASAPRSLPVRNTSQQFSLIPGDYVALSITDSGPGIPPEQQARIFDPFFTTKETGQGSGLGLAMVYGIVKQSGGDIEVRSAPQQGTTFTIWLPVTTEPVEAKPAKPLPAPKGSGTILVVEDEDMLRQAIQESLSVLGYNVIEAANGTAALESIEQHAGKIDLLLSDAVMPGISGTELIERARTLLPESRFVLMSGYANPALHGAGVPSAGVAFLRKPFSHAELGKLVKSLLGSEMQTSSKERS